MRTVWIVAAVLAALVVGALWYSGHTRDRYAAYEAQVAAEQDRTRESVAEAARYRAEADSAEGRAAAAVAVADTVRIRVREIVTRIDSIPVPADVLPHTAPRDSVIALQRVQLAALRSAVAEHGVAADALRAANATLAVTVERLERVIADRPRPRRAWVPVVTLGYGATVSRQDRRVHDGPVLSFGWQIGF